MTTLTVAFCFCRRPLPQNVFYCFRASCFFSADLFISNFIFQYLFFCIVTYNVQLPAIHNAVCPNVPVDCAWSRRSAVKLFQILAPASAKFRVSSIVFVLKPTLVLTLTLIYSFMCFSLESMLVAMLLTQQKLSYSSICYF